VRGDLGGDAVVTLLVEVVVAATDSGKASMLARQAIRNAIRSTGLSARTFRLTSGSCRKVPESVEGPLTSQER